MEHTMETLMAENEALKASVKVQAETINRLLNAYVLNIDSNDSKTESKN